MKLFSPTRRPGSQRLGVLGPFAFMPVIALATGAFFNGNTSDAAPAKRVGQQPRTLSFAVTARLGSQGGSGQTLASHVWTKGNKARIETSLSTRPVVFLLAPPYIYKLIPAGKAGVRWKNTHLQAGSPAMSLDFQSLVRNPAQIRAMLKSKGAKFAGSGKLDNEAVDIFEARGVAKNGVGRDYSAKGWLRKSDSLPVRLDIKSGGMAAVVTWRDYRHDAALADSLFKVPPGYQIRDAEGGPSLFGF